MNVLITGGAGFLGMHLAQRLVVLGNRVVLYDRSFDQIQSVSRGSAHDLAFDNQVVLIRTCVFLIGCLMIESFGDMLKTFSLF